MDVATHMQGFFKEMYLLGDSKLIKFTVKISHHRSQCETLPCKWTKGEKMLGVRRSVSLGLRGSGHREVRTVR